MAGDDGARAERPERWICDGEPSPRYPVWTRGNIGEVFPWPVTPATWSLGVVQCAEPGWRDALARFGAFGVEEFSDERTEVIGCFGGYGYLNASVTRILGVRTPGLTPEQMDFSLWGEMAGVPPYAPMPGDDDPSKTEAIQATLGWIFSAPDLTDLEADQRRMVELRAARPDFAAMADEEIVAWFRSHAPELRRLFADHLYITYCSTVPLGVIQGVCAAIGDPTLAMTLVAGIGGVDSAEPSYAFWDMGRQVRASAALTSEFDAGVSGLLDRLRASDGDDARAFLQAFDEFTYEFGSRGPNEWETSAPSWETDPDLPLAAIDRMRLADDDHAPRRHQEAMAAAREAAVPRVLAAVAGDPETHGQLSAALAAAPVFLAGRERTKTNIIRLVNEMRVGSYALGQRMVARGVYAKPTSGSMLSDDELDRFLADPEAWVGILKEREAQYEALFDLEPPFVFAGDPAPLRSWPERASEPTPVAAGTVLEGIPGCPGEATGRARVILDPSDPTELEPGDVLIAPITDPAWTPLFVPAAAVVVDVGAQLSHAVIVSRELGIPCVVSVTGGTRRIPDGATVTVDGTPGTVTVHESLGSAEPPLALQGLRRSSAPAPPHPRPPPHTPAGGLLREGLLEGGEDGDGAGVDAGLGGHVEAHEVALDHEVEELGEGALPLCLDVDDGVDDLVEDVVGEVEPPGDLRVLEVVSEAHRGHHLPGDVTVLAPAADLVVGHLGQDAGERRRLGVLVHLALEPVGGHAADGVAAVGDRDRATDGARQLLRGATVEDELVAPAPHLRHRLGDVLGCSGEEPDAFEDDEGRNAHRADAGARHGALGQHDVRRVPPRGEAPELAARGQHHHPRPGGGRRLGRLDRLLGVPRVGDGEAEGPVAD